MFGLFLSVVTLSDNKFLDQNILELKPKILGREMKKWMQLMEPKKKLKREMCGGKIINGGK